MKVLASGNVNGQFKTLFSRVQSIIKKSGQFDYLLCIGSFFADTTECNEQWASIKDGSLPVPLPIFVLGPDNVECCRFYEGVPAGGGELVYNITCLGQRGLYVTSDGLQIAYLSGSYDQNEYRKLHSDDSTLSPFFRQEDIQNLCHYSEDEGFKGIDILMTSEWPQGVCDYTTPPVSGSGWGQEGLVDVQRTGSFSVSKLAVHLCPRYHFSSSAEIFYERIPYRNHIVLSEQQKHCTRFIALSNVGNPNKKNRYLYAFSITPLKEMSKEELLKLPEAITDCPFQELLQRKNKSTSSLDDKSTSSDGGLASNYFFDVKSIEETRKQQQRENERAMRQLDPSVPFAKRRAPPRPSGPCWFCLSSPDIEKHLIVSIGNHSYLAFAKGGLVEEHVLILPIGHYQSSVDTPQEVLEEIYKFKHSLRKYFDTKKQSCVVFERNFRSQHLQLQVVPISSSFKSNDLRQTFIDAGYHHKLEFTEIERGCDLSQSVSSGAPYFVVEFPDGPGLLCKIKKGFFPIQFGREVLASPEILNVPQKTNWKDCSLGKDEETEITLKFRDNFQPFDFTLEDDDD